MNSITEISRDFLPTKENILTLSANIVKELAEGNGDPIKTAIQLAAMEKVCKDARDGMNELVLTELSKYNGKTELLGAKVERAEVGTKYDFSNSEAWTQIKGEIDALELELKSVETIAKTLPDSGQASYTRIATGETLTVVKAAKSSKTSFKITLGK